MNPQIAGANGVLTQVIPPNGQQVIQTRTNVLQNTQGQVPKALQQFFKGEPKALGAIQIMIGIIQFIFGIVLVSAVSPIYSVFVNSGIPFWGGVIFIISGSLSVAAKNKAKMCLVKGILVLNITGAVVAVIGIILIVVDLSSTYNSNYSCNNNYDSLYYNSDDNCQEIQGFLESAMNGIEGVLLVLMLLEFCISKSTCVFSCAAICYKPNNNMQSVVILHHEPKPETNFNPGPPPVYSVNDQFGLDPNFPFVPAPMYTDSSQPFCYGSPIVQQY
ncbi:membrane-spanning 4-domains subfamily A member 4A [Microcaecilia unicolor]|uniref:Membrane-spanning 4-domains subfamily A member 4A-like n=1 Tax=Microcaecilia unicolor TaxID=1415580 RepID=A0A6P7WSG2_9AMPH|nr:membrane-spanning 4-domains subfamily A member 4A-like [Microcaecilia unicolor]XP_030046132.1 membrane-spanning 4-domains subfamily A member 4A-like [Microcaecilia unicolor]XP_030046133.1 membrane-spanning 4-domains subfamily A member 4A-like [Microcaecilia unicolor]XP_030046134.1 membrane-spanning 4-domains subfamily A member 4A-like [Microcaecilia unicolor]